VLARAASLRAEGFSWSQTAEKLGFAGDDLRELCAGAGKHYDRLTARARRDVVYEGLSEAIHELRQYVRKHEDREKRLSADSLTRVGMTWYRHRPRSKVKVVPDPRVEGLSDQDIADARSVAEMTPEQLAKWAAHSAGVPKVCPKSKKVLHWGFREPVTELSYWEEPGYDGSKGNCVG